MTSIPLWDQGMLVCLTLLIVVGVFKSMGAKTAWKSSSQREFVRDCIPGTDLNRILLVDRLSFPPDRERTEDEFREDLTIGCRIAVYDAPCAGLLGFVVYYVKPQTRLEIVRFAVQPAARKKGVAHELMAHIFERAAEVDIDDIVCDVSEDYVAAQLFLRSWGFRCTQTLGEDCRIEPSCDMYRFVNHSEMYCPLDTQ